MKKLIPLFLLILATGCVEVGGSSSGTDVCVGENCGDNNTETTETADTTED